MKRKVLKPNVIGGGQAIPIGNNFYYMRGRKHSQGGIDIGANPKTGLEVEDGEVMHLTNKDIKVYSSVPFLNGKSPAQKVMGGENPTKVFNEQERYKKRKGINDDGSKKKENGGISILNKKTMNKINNELSLIRKQYRTGGLYSLTVDGETKMRQFPTGKRTKAGFGTINVNKPTLLKAEPLATIDIKPLHEFKAEPAKLPTTKRNIPNLSEVKPVDVPVYKKESWLKRTMNKLGVEPNDVASIIPNIAGSIITHSINSRMLNTFKEPQAPIARQAIKLKTRINIEPQLDKMREILAEYERQVDNNTASSNVALARKNNFRLANIMNTNALYADKENKETALINQDRLNRQSVIDANIREYNEYLARRNQYQNTIAEKRAENSVGLINNINAGIQNVLGNIEKRRSEDRTIKAMMAPYPDLPIELFEKGDIITTKAGDWYRAGIGRNRRGMKNTI